MTHNVRRPRVVATWVLLCLIAVGAPGCAGGDDTGAHADADVGAEVETPVAPVQTTAPVGTWTLASSASGGRVTFVVKESGEFSGSGPCNNYFGRWSLGAAQDTLGPVGATRKMCAPEAMDAEQAFFNALGTVAGWRATDGGIALVDPSGAVVLAFTSKGK